MPIIFLSALHHFSTTWEISILISLKMRNVFKKIFSFFLCIYKITKKLTKKNQSVLEIPQHQRIIVQWSPFLYVSHLYVFKLQSQIISLHSSVKIFRLYDKSKFLFSLIRFFFLKNPKFVIHPRIENKYTAYIFFLSFSITFSQNYSTECHPT